jgi:transcription initiation factor TFIID TATA-box-binding protein
MVMIVEIENVVTTIDCGCKFDLEYILKYSEALKDPQFEGARFRFAQSQTVVTVYQKGTLVCVGAKSSDSAWNAMNIVLKRLGIHNITRNDMSIDNIIVNITLHSTILESNIQNMIKALMKIIGKNNTEYVMEGMEKEGAFTFKKDDITVKMRPYSGQMFCSGKDYDAILELGNKIEKNLANL